MQSQFFLLCIVVVGELSFLSADTDNTVFTAAK